MSFNPDKQPPPPARPESAESREGEPLTIHVYAQEVRARFTDPAGAQRVDDKTWYRWEGQLWERAQGGFVPGNKSFNKNPDLAQLASNLRHTTDAHTVAERKEAGLPSYRMALYPSDAIKAEREQQLRSAANVEQATVRALTATEIQQFKAAYQGNAPQQSVEKKSPPPTSEQEQKAVKVTAPRREVEAIPLELQQRLHEAAAAAHMPDSEALMNERLRELVSDVRRNYSVHLNCRFGDGEHPHATHGEFWTTGNQRALDQAGSWQNLTRSDVGGPHHRLGIHYHRTPEQKIEVVGIVPPDATGHSRVFYYYSAKDLLSGDMHRAGSQIAADVMLPSAQAEELYALLEQHPQHARQFFIAVSLDAPGAQSLWQGDPRRRPSAIANMMLFHRQTENSLELTAKSGSGDSWSTAPIPEKLQQTLASARQEIGWEQELKKQRQQQEATPPQPSLWQRLKNRIFE